jgi:hypothetical protein
MNKIILVAVGVLVIAGGVFYYTQQEKDSNTNSTITQNESVPSNDTNAENENLNTNTNQPQSGQAASLAELAQGGAKRCEVTIDMSSEDPNMSDYSGVFYSDGQGKYRSEVWQQSRPESKYFTLVSNPWVYTWTNYDSRGVKAQATGSADNSTSSELNTNGFEQPYNFDCSNWTIDASMFEPPTNITFSDLPQFAQ